MAARFHFVVERETEGETDDFEVQRKKEGRTEGEREQKRVLVGV